MLEVRVRKGKMSYNNNVRGSCKILKMNCQSYIQVKLKGSKSGQE